MLWSSYPIMAPGPEALTTLGNCENCTAFSVTNNRPTSAANADNSRHLKSFSSNPFTTHSLTFLLFCFFRWYRKWDLFFLFLPLSWTVNLIAYKPLHRKGPAGSSKLLSYNPCTSPQHTRWMKWLSSKCKPCSLTSCCGLFGWCFPLSGQSLELSLSIYFSQFFNEMWPHHSVNQPLTLTAEIFLFTNIYYVLLEFIICWFFV